MNYQEVCFSKKYLISTKTNTKTGKNPNFPQDNDNKKREKNIIQHVNVLLAEHHLKFVGHLRKE